MECCKTVIGIKENFLKAQHPKTSNLKRKLLVKSDEFNKWEIILMKSKNNTIK